MIISIDFYKICTLADLIAHDTEKIRAIGRLCTRHDRHIVAQQTEKDRVQSLLFDLCRGVQEPPQPKRGRKRMLMADMVFAAALKVYSTFSSRRFARLSMPKS